MQTLPMRIAPVLFALALFSLAPLALAPFSLAPLALAQAPGTRAGDPPWMPHVEALLARPGQGPAALAFLAARPLSERQSHGALWLQARAAQAAEETASVAEAMATATLLLPGPARDYSFVRPWLTTRARQAQARALALAQAGRSPALAVPHFLAAVKADGAVLADDDRGLRAASLAVLRAAAEAAPAHGRAQFELGWHLYFQGENGAARRAFERARDRAAGPYDKWQSQLWLDRIDREAASAKADEAASDARAAKERIALDAQRAADDKKAAAAKAKKDELDREAELAAAKKRRHEILMELIEADRQIRTLRERRMIRLTPDATGLSAQGIYNYLSELKAEEDAVRERKRKLEEEREALPTR